MDTLGSLIDKLSVVNLKIWHQEELAHAPDASDEVVAGAKRKINVLNNQRNDLIEEIDVLVHGVMTGKIPPPKVFRQLKNYTKGG